MNLITVKVADHPTQLAVAQSYLEAEGIQCFVRDEHMSMAYPIAASGIGGAKLEVGEQDVRRAITLLIEGGFATEEDYADTQTTGMKWIEKVVDKISAFGKKK